MAQTMPHATKAFVETKNDSYPEFDAAGGDWAAVAKEAEELP